MSNTTQPQSMALVPVIQLEALNESIKNLTLEVKQLKNKGYKETLSTKEVMSILQCSRNTLQSYVNKGWIKPIKINKVKYAKPIYRRADIEYYLETQESKGF